MLKKISLILLTVLVSCTNSKQTKDKVEVCKKDQAVVCRRENSPVLEKMDDREVSAGIYMLRASYRKNSSTSYMVTEFTELNQCIGVYQYYNCKAYCESDTISKESKIKRDNEIVENCKKQIALRKAKEKKAIDKEITSKKEGKRILIWLDTGDFEINKTLEDLIYLAFEEEATSAKVKYTIISQEVRDAAIAAIKIEQGMDQNDPRFLPQLRKQLAANFFGQITVKPMFEAGDKDEGKRFILANRFSHIETATTIAVSTLKYYPSTTKNEYDDLFNKFKKLAKKFFKKVDSKYLDNVFNEEYQLNIPEEKIEEKVEKKEREIDEIKSEIQNTNTGNPSDW